MRYPLRNNAKDYFPEATKHWNAAIGIGDGKRRKHLTEPTEFNRKPVCFCGCKNFEP